MATRVAICWTRAADRPGRASAAGRAVSPSRAIAATPSAWQPPGSPPRRPPRSRLCSRPAARARHGRGVLPVVRRPARALFGSWYEFFPRSEGAPASGTGTVPPATSAPPPSGCPRSRRWASTSSTCRRSTRSASVTARARTTPSPPGPDDVGVALGHRLARTAGTTRSHPDLGTIDDFDALRGAGARELGLEVALDFALQCSPDHPWVTRAPRVVHHRARRHDRLRGEPAEEVPGHLPDQLRQRPATALRTRCCAWCGSGSAHGVRIFRVDNPHTKPVAFWELAHRARSTRDRPRGASSSPRRSPARR